MKRLGLLVVLALTTVAAYAAALNSKWVTPEPVFSNGGIDIFFAFNLENPQTATISSICRMGGRELIASVSVPYSATESELSMLGTANAEVEENGFKCNVSVEPATIKYTASDRELILSDSGRELRFVRQ